MSETFDSRDPSHPEGVAASGEALRQAREARGLSRSDVAQMLKLSSRQIQAIEEEQFDKLPGQAWVRGFVRNYARYLGLDPAPLLERLDPHSVSADPHLTLISNAEGAVPAEPDGYKSPSALPALLAVGVLVIGGLVFWYSGFATKKQHPAPATIPAASAPAVENSEPAFPPVSEDTAVVTAQAEPAPAGVAQSAVAAPLATTSAPAAVQSAAAKAPAQSAAASNPVASAAEGQRLEFTFAEDAWVEVRDSSGKIIYSRLNKAGETQVVQGTPPLALVVGNAHSVTLRYKGKDIPLGERAKVNVARFTLE